MTDRIEKKITLRASQSRVWRAITNASEFGTWFGMKFEGEFAAGRPAKGKFDHPKYAHLTFAIEVERIDPETLFSYRWHPYALDPNVDYSKEPTTLVEFRLEPAGEGTELTVVESGFDGIPAARRDEAFRMNDNGWSAQVKNIQKHVDG